MSALLLSPHNDDAVLFAAYACIRHDPLVVTVLRSHDEAREGEDVCAFAELGVSRFEQWPYPDSAPDWGAVENALRLLDERVQPERVFAPAAAFEANGHSPDEVPPVGWGILQHDMVGAAAERVFGPERLTRYLTYTRWGGRSTDGVEIVGEPAWVQRKLRALACYGSQIAAASTRAWFVDQLDVREWVAA